LFLIKTDRYFHCQGKGFRSGWRWDLTLDRVVVYVAAE